MDARHHPDTATGLVLPAFLLAGLLAATLLSACSPQPTTTPGSTTQGGAPADGSTTPAAGPTLITPTQLAEMLKDKDFVLVNTHIPYEGELEKTDLFIPYDRITEPENLARLPADKNAKIVLYCQSDRMSGIAAAALSRLGYTNLYDLGGGFVAWEAEGRRLIERQR